MHPIARHFRDCGSHAFDLGQKLHVWPADTGKLRGRHGAKVRRRAVQRADPSRAAIVVGLLLFAGVRALLKGLGVWV